MGQGRRRHRGPRAAPAPMAAGQVRPAPPVVVPAAAGRPGARHPRAAVRGPRAVGADPRVAVRGQRAAPDADYGVGEARGKGRVLLVSRFLGSLSRGSHGLGSRGMAPVPAGMVSGLRTGYAGVAWSVNIPESIFLTGDGGRSVRALACRAGFRGSLEGRGDRAPRRPRGRMHCTRARVANAWMAAGGAYREALPCLVVPQA